MGFEFWPAVIAGILGGATMTLLMKTAHAAGMTGMDMAVIEGAFVTDDAGKARGIGLFVHLVVMSGLLIGSIYALLFDAFGVGAGDAWWVGATFGVAHGLLAGVMMGMLGSIHPRMATSGVAPANASADAGLVLREPGMFAHNYGSLTPMGLMVAHVAYGLVVGLVYSWLV